MFLLKQRYPHLKVLLSVGGWEWSDNFSDAFHEPERRKRAVETATTIIKEYGLDGLDIGTTLIFVTLL
jgi:GH18 family chitinase